MSEALTEGILTKLMVESILACGLYIPTDNFLNGRSVALQLDEKPIILLGWENDAVSHQVADRLLKNKEFKNLLVHEYGHHSTLNKTIVENSAVCAKDKKYHSVIESEQGKLNETGDGVLVALIVDDKVGLGFGICINNDIMKCFYPNAQPLSQQVFLSEPI